MTDRTKLGDRMKAYEGVEKYVLPFRTPVILRIDGKAFHTYTKGFDRPFDKRLKECMSATARALVDNIQGAEIAYVQSDEISILLNNYKRFNSNAWFDNKVQKICSVSASIATAAFNSRMYIYEATNEPLPEGVYSKVAMFDSRCFTVPVNEVVNYFSWRQRDAIKNSVSMVAQNNFSHKDLQGLNGTQMKDKLKNFGTPWEDIPIYRQRGWCVVRKPVERNGAQRTEILPDYNVPIFSENRDYIEQYTKQIEE